MIPETLEPLAVPITDLNLYDDNPRQGDLDAICESLETNGQYRPIVVNRRDMRILAGNHTYKAAKRLGWETIAATFVDVDEDEARRIVLVDNRSNDIASYDDYQLAAMLEAIVDDQGVAGLIGTGFDADAIDALLEGLEPDEPEGLTDPDDVPEVQADAVTVAGDVWLLGKHRVMCGDSTIPEHVRKLLKGEKATLLHADPPYGMGKQKDGIANDNLYQDKLDTFQMLWWKTVRPYLEDNATVYIWGNPEDLWRLWYVGGLRDSERMTYRNEVVWDKGSGFGMSSAEGRSYPISTERCLVVMLGEQGFNINADNYWEGWEPIRSYLEQEMNRCGWTKQDLNRITGTHMASHWVTKSQWHLITEEHYKKIQREAQNDDAFKRDYDAFKRDYDALKREFYETRAYFDNTHDNMTEVWNYPRVHGENRYGHATPKPVEMISRAIKSSAPKGALVVEPFGGTGSTLMAAEASSRICYTMELDEHYVDVICRRYEQHTGTTPILEATGQPHSFVQS